MPTTEKEYNGYLFDQLSLIEETAEIAKRENAAETLAFLEKKKRQVERKLYQKPPLVKEE